MRQEWWEARVGWAAPIRARWRAVSTLQGEAAAGRGQSLLNFLHWELGFTPDPDQADDACRRAAQDHDRLLALDVLVTKKADTVERSENVEAYLRGAVDQEAEKQGRREQWERRTWERIDQAIPDEAVDSIDPETRQCRLDEWRERPARRPMTPAVAQLIADAPALRARGLSPEQEKVLALVELGVRGADAERLVGPGCARRVFASLLMASRRLHQRRA